MGKSTMSMAIFNSFLLVYQRVSSMNHDELALENPTASYRQKHNAAMLRQHFGSKALGFNRP
jgi:hypothetical protein